MYFQLNDHNHNIQPIYTLGVISKLSNISPYSIRQYIDSGLILPFTTKTGRHLFSEIDLLRLKCVKHCLSDMRLNIAGIKALLALIPCWKITNCSLESQKKCDAYYSNSYPCWEASEKGKECKNKNCRVCSVYSYPEKCEDLKSFLKNYF